MNEILQYGSNEGPYISVNIVEDLVKSRAPDFVEKLGGCSCSRCIVDIIAMTLNNMPPKYIVTEKGMLFSKISSYEKQFSADLTAALTRSCIAIKNNPRH